MKSIEINVRGLPIAQGSSKGFVVNGRAVITSASKGLKPWRSVIAGQAQDAVLGLAPLDEPIAVDMQFRFPRPKAHFGKRGLKPTAPKHLCAKGKDLDKLLRAVCDALTKVVWRDDRLVCRASCEKTYADEAHPPGVSVTVYYELDQQGEGYDESDWYGKNVRCTYIGGTG